MNEPVVLLPSADHPLIITPTGKRVAVHVKGELVADTFNALTVSESNYPEVQYIPIADAVNQVLLRSNTSTYCPYKGYASYYSIKTAVGTVVEDAVWTYERPHPAASAIAGLLAFYPDRADITVDGSRFDGAAPTCDCRLGT